MLMYVAVVLRVAVAPLMKKQTAIEVKRFPGALAVG